MSYVARLPDTWPELLPDSNLTLFILGLLAMRHGVIDAPRANRRRIHGWMAFGFVAWISWWVVIRHVADRADRDSTLLASGLGLLQDQWLCFTCIGAALLLLASRPWLTSRLALVGQAGRMALTNYIAQVVIVDVLASGYGVGLRRRPFLYLPAAVLLFVVLALASRAWLARHRMGPLEWVWRCVTYGRVERLPA
jgi:uncharacterized protein